MTDLEQLKRDGAAAALKEHIGSLRYTLINGTWDGIKEKYKFCRLGEALDDAESLITQMREALAALQELDPEHK